MVRAGDIRVGTKCDPDRAAVVGNVIDSVRRLVVPEAPVDEARSLRATFTGCTRGPGTVELAPAGPTGPCGPCGPGTVEAAPVAPVGPGGPWGPTGPPAGPGGPSAPAGPCGPGMPSPAAPTIGTTGAAAVTITFGGTTTEVTIPSGSSTVTWMSSVGDIRITRHCALEDGDRLATGLRPLHVPEALEAGLLPDQRAGLLAGQ
jgi:hypothetical protein